MAKELPYFRFYASEWLEGNITLEDETTQGLFITICAWYWKKDCQITKEFISKRLIKNNQLLSKCLDKLIDEEILKFASDLLVIRFLDIQYEQLSGISLKRSRAGRKGGKANVKQMLKQKSSYKDKDNDKENNKDNDKEAHPKKLNLEIRKEEFRKLIEPMVDEVAPKANCKEFFFYWTEPNPSNTKMRFELEKTWDTKRRLIRWMKNADVKQLSKKDEIGRDGIGTINKIIGNLKQKS